MFGVAVRSIWYCCQLKVESEVDPDLARFERQAVVNAADASEERVSGILSSLLKQYTNLNSLDMLEWACLSWNCPFELVIWASYRAKQ